jgi:hypothetical protein
MTRTLRYKHQRSCRDKDYYAHEPEAQEARQRDTAQYGAIHYVYECPWCFGWHLTRQPQKRK